LPAPKRAKDLLGCRSDSGSLLQRGAGEGTRETTRQNTSLLGSRPRLRCKPAAAFPECRSRADPHWLNGFQARVGVQAPESFPSLSCSLPPPSFLFSPLLLLFFLPFPSLPFPCLSCSPSPFSLTPFSPSSSSLSSLPSLVVSHYEWRTSLGCLNLTMRVVSLTT